jgi:hypothetical protein
MELDLDQARRRAKELLRAARARSPEALARFRDDRAPRLADAQRAVATDLGFASWPALVHHVEATRGDRRQRRARLVDAALDNRADVAERLLARDPSLAAAGLDVALVLGDDAAAANALRVDPGLVSRGKPLSTACGSAFLKTPRATGVLRVVKLLLDHGADPNDGESLFRSMYADDTACAELLLDRGATVRGTGALGYAISDHSVAKVRLLLERGDQGGTALHFAGHWGRASTVELLLARGADVHLQAGDVPGNALAWTAWGSSHLPGSRDRPSDYLAVAAILLAAGSEVTEEMVRAASHEVAAMLSERTAHRA